MNNENEHFSKLDNTNKNLLFENLTKTEEVFYDLAIAINTFYDTVI